MLSTALPILLFMHLIRRTGPTRASMVGYLAPVWTILFAVLFLNERVGFRELPRCRGARRRGAGVVQPGGRSKFARRASRVWEGISRTLRRTIHIDMDEVPLRGGEVLTFLEDADLVAHGGAPRCAS